VKLALIGYGKMGRMLDHFAPEYGFEVTHRLDIQENLDGAGINAQSLADVDVAIEFSVPEATVRNVERLAAAGVNVVVGTTGWLQHLPHVRQVVESSGVGLVWSPNYSIGVNVFLRLVSEAARLMQNYPEYQAWGWEIHHSAKKDAPSGTLLKLYSAMQQAGYTRNVDLSSSRAGAHPGTHEIGFDAAADTLTLRHVARNREGFARGALRAAQWIARRKGFYEFSEVLFGEEPSRT
jgi:4-hydroxy-tetrahydrodipicolinate reductase